MRVTSSCATTLLGPEQAEEIVSNQQEPNVLYADSCAPVGSSYSNQSASSPYMHVYNTFM